MCPGGQWFGGLTACVPTESGRLRKPGDVLVKPAGFGDLIDNDALWRCLQKEWLAPTVDRQRAMERLHVAEFTLAHLLECLQNTDALAVAKRPGSWLAALYNYAAFLDDQDSYESHLPALQRARILRLAESNGQGVSAHQCRQLHVLQSWPASLAAVSAVRLSGGTMVALDPSTVPAAGEPGLRFLARYGLAG